MAGGSAVSRRSPQYFEIERILRGFEAGQAVVEREDAVDQRARVDFSGRECVERRLKAAASRTDRGDFINHDWRQFNFSRRCRGALQDDLSARPRQFNRAPKTGSTSTAIDHNLEFVPHRRFLGRIESEFSQPREFLRMMALIDLWTCHHME